MTLWHPDCFWAATQSGKHNNSNSNNTVLTDNNNSSKAASPKPTPDLTTSINHPVTIMILPSLLVITCLISPVFLDNEMVRKKLVRRRKQNWGSEEDGNYLSPRHISPVKKVFKRKIVNSEGNNGAQSQKQLVRRKVIPHILPDNQNIDAHFSSTNRIFPTPTNHSISPHTNEAVPNKPMDAKRCKFLLT